MIILIAPYIPSKTIADDMGHYYFYPPHYRYPSGALLFPSIPPLHFQESNSYIHYVTREGYNFHSRCPYQFVVKICCCINTPRLECVHVPTAALPLCSRTVNVAISFDHAGMGLASIDKNDT